MARDEKTVREDERGARKCEMVKIMVYLREFLTFSSSLEYMYATGYKFAIQGQMGYI